MFRHERYAQGTGALMERVEIERQSPTVVRYRRHNQNLSLVEDRAATDAEIVLVDNADRQEGREQARRDFVRGIDALPGANPLKAILRDLLQWKGWD